MRAIIIDDELANLQNLQVLLVRHCPLVEVVASAQTRDDAVTLINQLQPDLLFLDIHLGDATGFEVLQSVRHQNFEVIFVTAFDRYGIQAIKFAALDYLLKPIDIDELMQAVTKADARVKAKQTNQQLGLLLNHLQQGRSHPQKIALPQFKETRYVQTDQIRRCQADNTYTLFFLASGEQLLISKPLKEYAELLQPQGFIRTHQSHLINASFVKSWLREDGGTLLLDNGEHIPIAKINREKVRALLAKPGF
ncbi:LytTR family DNA-binding domain-containing protein [Mucilaginibacter sp. CSA2-8R]|uniref:LytR/AlgR family response regulator transcription factor n=1 Tax=Mucilaginibacter sp. CSA2-8R TaxID=3141542 RepID=UPI00315D14F8